MSRLPLVIRPMVTVVMLVKRPIGKEIIQCSERLAFVRADTQERGKRLLGQSQSNGVLVGVLPYTPPND